MKKITKWKETIKALILYPFIRQKITNLDANIFFFFPQYQTGGAERVHLNIMKSVAESRPTCFITDLSVNHDLRDEFKRYARLINLHRWGWKTSFRKKMAKQLAAEINKIEKPIVFGSNSEFFYDLLPYLKASCVKIDLLHTDLSHLPLSIENYAVPVTSSLTQRVLLGEGHKEKLKAFYQRKGIPKQEIEKVRIIPNGIPIPPDPPPVKDYSGNLTVLFVGRNSHEKRPELFLKIAAEALRQNLPFSFQMIGDFESFAKNKPDNLQIIGKIKDVHKLNEHYRNAHFIFITSLFEGFPMVISEGMAQGVIPMATDVGEIRMDINQKKNTGFIIPSFADADDIVDGFINKMQEVTKNRDKLRVIAYNGYQLAKVKFSDEMFRKRYRNLLTQQFSLSVIVIIVSKFIL